MIFFFGESHGSCKPCTLFYSGFRGWSIYHLPKPNGHDPAGYGFGGTRLLILCFIMLFENYIVKICLGIPKGFMLNIGPPHFCYGSTCKVGHEELFSGFGSSFLLQAGSICKVGKFSLYFFFFLILVTNMSGVIPDSTL